MLLPGFDIRKAAQAVAFLVLKAGGSINVLKLSKLVYLAEREFMARYDAPMFYDKLVSMPDGPVASITLNLINGNLEDSTWSSFVAKRQGYDVSVVDEMSFAKLDNLSKADVTVLSALWDKFGNYDKYALRDWTHQKKNIPEWNDPLGSSRVQTQSYPECDERCECDGGYEVSSELVVAGCDASEVLQAAEGVFDEMAALVALDVVPDCALAI